MAINLVSLVSQFLTPQLVGALARAVGVNEAVAQRLVAAAIPDDSRGASPPPPRPRAAPRRSSTLSRTPTPTS